MSYAQANFENVLFPPKLGALPDLISLATVTHFRSIKFHQRLGIPALVELRAANEIIRTIRIALLFSLLSAFQIGWCELHVGNWITQVQSREYHLKATAGCALWPGYNHC